MNCFNQINQIVSDFFGLEAIESRVQSHFIETKYTQDFIKGFIQPHVDTFYKKIEQSGYSFSLSFIRETNGMNSIIIQVNEDATFESMYIFSGEYSMPKFAYADMMYQTIKYLQSKKE